MAQRDDNDKQLEGTPLGRTLTDMHARYAQVIPHVYLEFFSKDLHRRQRAARHVLLWAGTTEH